MTREALEWMWTLQRDDGAWEWIKTERPPLEADDYYGAVFAAVGVGHAPDGYAESAAATSGLAKLRAYLKRNTPPNLHHEAMLLWASMRLPDLMPSEQQAATTAKLLAAPARRWRLESAVTRQLDSARRHARTIANVRRATATARASWSTCSVKRAYRRRTPPSRARSNGSRANQRESGRWFTRSLSQDTYHFISHAGDRLCGDGAEGVRNGGERLIEGSKAA